MNWNEIEGKWKQMTGSIKERWGDFTDDEIQELSGKREKFLGALQVKYGMTQEAAERELDDWASKHGNA